MLSIRAFNTRHYRLALAFSLAILTIVGLVFGIVYLRIAQEDFDRVGAILEAEAARSTTLDMPTLEDALRLRVTHDLRRVDYVALFDSRGVKLFGNIDVFPSIERDGLAHFVPQGRYIEGADREPALFVARRRADGNVVLLGRNLVELYEIETNLLRALAISFAPTFLAVFALGAWFRHRAAKRLNDLKSAISRVISGEFSSRLPVSRHADDIDLVAADVNVMLNEIARLLDQLKRVGDNVAHDLRTPLSVVRAKLEGALDHDAIDPVLRQTLEIALGQIDRAALTIEAILRVSSLEVGAKERRFVALDLRDIVKDIVEFYAPLAEEKAIALNCDLASAPLRGDAGLLGEAISNLIDNAIKYTPQGGRIDIRTFVEDGAAAFRIVDTGPGLAAGDKDKVFERFFRGANTSGTPGNGLGLDIARTIARLHGMDVVAMDQGAGGVFEMRAPARSASGVIAESDIGAVGSFAEGWRVRLPLPGKAAGRQRG